MMIRKILILLFIIQPFGVAFSASEAKSMKELEAKTGKKVVSGSNAKKLLKVKENKKIKRK